MKTCGKCKEALPLNSFSKSSGAKDGKQRECRNCRKERQKQSGEAGRLRASNYYERTKQIQEDRRKQRVDGLSPEMYTKLLAQQEGKCALAGQGVCAGVLCVDHNHETKEIRGLLCRAHNKALGIFGDTAQGLEAALRYLNDSIIRPFTKL
jgi:hypothetical protein